MGLLDFQRMGHLEPMQASLAFGETGRLEDERILLGQLTSQRSRPVTSAEDMHWDRMIVAVGLR